MKKRFSLFLCFIFLFTFITACSNSQSSKGWTVEDFSLYDGTGKEIAFPVENEDISLAKLTEEKGTGVQTKRGVQIGDRAITALQKYDIDGFYYGVSNFWGDGSATKDQADEKNDSFHEDYPTFSEALQHCDELTSTGLVLYASMSFYSENNGGVIPYQLNKNGNPEERDMGKDTYSLYVIIENEKIKDINFEVVKANPLAIANKVDSLSMELPHNKNIKFGDSQDTVEKTTGALIEDDPRVGYKSGFTQNDTLKLQNSDFYVTYFFDEADKLYSVRYVGEYTPAAQAKLNQNYKKLYGEPLTLDLYEEGEHHPYWRVEDEKKTEISAESHIDENNRIVSFCTIH